MSGTGVGDSYQRDWPRYFDCVAGKPPRETLVRALDAFEREPSGGVARLALDLACGEGRDTREMLRRTKTRWRVVAADAHEEAVRRCLDGLSLSDITRVTVCRLAMEDVPGAPLPASFDLVNASFALPFCDPARFPALWAWIVSRLAVGGRFAGQFFGDRDEWASIRPGSHHARASVSRLLEPFEVEHLDEVDKRGDDAMGGEKHHHVFHVVARKR